MTDLPAEFPNPDDDADYDTPLKYEEEWVEDEAVEIDDDEVIA